MSKTVEVLLSRRVTIGMGEAAGDHLAGDTVKVSEDVAASIVGQGAGVVVEAEAPPPPEAPVKPVKQVAAEAKA